MSNSYSVIHDWWLWVILVVAIITGLILLVCKLVLEFPGLCDWKQHHRRPRDSEEGGKSLRQISRTFVRKISGRGNQSDRHLDDSVEEEEIMEETAWNKKRPRKDLKDVDGNVITHDGNDYPLYKHPREFIRKLSRRGNEGRNRGRTQSDKESRGGTVSDGTEYFDEDVRDHTEDIPDDKVRDEKTNKSYLRGRVKKSQEFVRKISGHGLHSHRSERNRDRELGIQNNVRNGKRTKSSLRKFVRKLSQRGNNRITEDSEEDDEDVGTVKKGDKFQSVIRITPARSGRGPLKITQDFVRKISMRGRDSNKTKCNREEVDCDENQAKTRKPGVCVVYYYPTATDRDLEDIHVIPMEFDKEKEESKKVFEEKTVQSIDICDEKAVEGDNIDVVPREETSISLPPLEETC